MRIDTHDIRYRNLMEEITHICLELDICVYKPDYHCKENDAATVLLYTPAALKYNAQVDKEHFGTPPQALYEPYICSLEFTDVNGHITLDFANRGKIDLRYADAITRLAGYIRCQYAVYQQKKHIVAHGGIENIREADDEYNNLTREMAVAFSLWHPKVCFGNINHYGNEREEIVRANSGVFHSHPTNSTLQTFQYAFCIPEANDKLERAIVAWNSSDVLGDKAYQPISEITADILRLGGMMLDWR